MLVSSARASVTQYVFADCSLAEYQSSYKHYYQRQADLERRALNVRHARKLSLGYRTVGKYGLPHIGSMQPRSTAQFVYYRLTDAG
jgi:hypothetical protein